jgi:hypothetical protein
MSAFHAGSVWWGLIDFNDGEGERKKYFVLLTDCANDGEQSCVAITTSKGDTRYGAGARAQSPCGCPNLPCFRIEAAQESCFPATTWVQFDNAHAISRAGLEKLKKDGKADFVRTLLNCAKKCQDIAQRDLVRIDQTLKALNPTKKAAPPLTVPKAHPSSGVDPEIQSARKRIERYCADCHAEFIGLVGITATNLASILRGSTQPPNDFIENAQAGFELISGCGKCS